MKRAVPKRVNGHGANGHGGVVTLTRPELEARADKIASELLHVSRGRAFTMLDQGKLRGTLAESALAPLRNLLK